MLSGLGDNSGETATLMEAKRLAEKAAAAHRDSDEASYLLAACLESMSTTLAERRPEEGLGAARRALAIMKGAAERNSSVIRYEEELSACHSAIAFVLHDMGRAAETIAEYEQAIAINQRLADAQPEVFRFQDKLAKLHNNVASALLALNKPVESVAGARPEFGIPGKTGHRASNEQRVPAASCSPPDRLRLAAVENSTAGGSIGDF